MLLRRKVVHKAGGSATKAVPAAVATMGTSDYRHFFGNTDPAAT